ncbi:hypothetical protein SAMN03097699_0229 [Flavobacteriaceae bacterium MAR_2010_188]|nr:hypothetical protein SAMN03097699_0229 [Flavobacteriaceae bacterium MAR_2010_188]
MKSYFNLFLVCGILSFLNCSNDDNDSNANDIEGEWKLIKIETYFSEETTFDYTDRNIIYDFQSDGKLVVSGGENLGYSDGEYKYEFVEDYLSPEPLEGESKEKLVIIDENRWIYEKLNSTTISISQAYVDGPTIFLKRRN